MPTCAGRWSAVTAVGAVGANSTVLRFVACASVAVRTRIVWHLEEVPCVFNASSTAALPASGTVGSLAPVLSRAAALAAAVRAHRRRRAGCRIPFSAAAGWTLADGAGGGGWCMIGAKLRCVAVIDNRSLTENINSASREVMQNLYKGLVTHRIWIPSIPRTQRHSSCCCCVGSARTALAE